MFLLDKIEDPINRQLDVNQEFTDAKQRHSQTVNNFDNYLTSLEAQLPPFDETQRAFALVTRLRLKLQKDIVHVGYVSTTRSEVVSLAARLEGPSFKKQRGDASNSNSGNPNAGNPNSGGDNASDKGLNRPSKAERTAQSRKDKEENAARKSQGKGKGKSDDKDWKKNIECFNCHKKGHYANECRAPKNENPNNVLVGSVGSIGAHAVKSRKVKPLSPTTP